MITAVRSSIGMATLAAALAAGCSDNRNSDAPRTVHDRQDAILADPFGYKPEDKPSNISGGKMHELDRNAMKKDLNNVFNP